MKKLLLLISVLVMALSTSITCFAQETRKIHQGDGVYTYYNNDGKANSLYFYRLGGAGPFPIYMTEDDKNIYLMCEKNNGSGNIYYMDYGNGDELKYYVASQNVSEHYAVVTIPKGSTTLGLTWEDTLVFRDALIEYNEKNNLDTPLNLYYVEDIHKSPDTAKDLYQRHNILDEVIVSVESKHLWFEYIDTVKVLAVVSIGIMAGIISFNLIKRVLVRFT